MRLFSQSARESSQVKYRRKKETQFLHLQKEASFFPSLFMRMQCA